jgi:hypothetical protein
MPSRRLPIRNEGRYIALRNAKTKANNTPGQTVIQATTLAKLDIAFPELQGLLQDSQVALVGTDRADGYCGRLVRIQQAVVFPSNSASERCHCP